MRICSLLPSATEIVADLGLTGSLVAVSEECDWPPDVRLLPVVTTSRVDTSRLSSLEIEQAAREAISDGRPLYAIDRDILDELEPDLILTQNLCAVCAVSADAVEELCATDAEVVALDAHTMGEIEERIISLADLLGVPARGQAVVDRMQATIAAISERVAGAPARPVFVAEWLEPPYSAGHWIPEMVALAGGQDVLGQAGAPSYPTSWDAVRAQRPELVVVAPCGFDHERAAREASLPRSAAAPSPSTPTRTTPDRRHALPTALRSSPSSSTRNSSLTLGSRTSNLQPKRTRCRNSQRETASVKKTSVQRQPARANSSRQRAGIRSAAAPCPSRASHAHAGGLELRPGRRSRSSSTWCRTEMTATDSAPGNGCSPDRATSADVSNH